MDRADQSDAVVWLEPDARQNILANEWLAGGQNSGAFVQVEAIVGANAVFHVDPDRVTNIGYS